MTRGGRGARRALGLWLPPLAWMAAIFWLSGRPDLPHAPGALLDLLVKKAMHAAAYGVLALLYWRALAPTGLRRPAVWAAALAIAYAVTDEWHQTRVPGRTGRALDVLIDAAGAIAAVGVATFYRSGRWQ